MRSMKNVFQIVFIMEDGVELPWKMIETQEKALEYIMRVPAAALNSIGIVRIGYRVRFIE